MRLKNIYGEQVYYFFSDHLGSTNVITDPNGNITSETLYKAWGEIRYSSGSSPTDFTYTGQRSEMDDIGLMFYNARWYDPELGRFAQADTIVPGAGNPAAYDRYAYVVNNPIKLNDPSGHDAGCSAADPSCWEQNAILKPGVTNENVPYVDGLILRGHNLKDFQIPIQNSKEDVDKYWWSPLSYDTMELKIGGMIKGITGSDISISIFWNWKAIRDFDFFKKNDGSVNINFTYSAGLSAEASAYVMLAGHNGSVHDQSSIEMIGRDGVGVNGSACLMGPPICFLNETNILQESNELHVDSIGWGLGIGELVDASVDLISVSEWIYYIDAKGLQPNYGPFIHLITDNK